MREEEGWQAERNVFVILCMVTCGPGALRCLCGNVGALKHALYTTALFAYRRVLGLTDPNIRSTGSVASHLTRALLPREQLPMLRAQFSIATIHNATRVLTYNSYPTPPPPRPLWPPSMQVRAHAASHAGYQGPPIDRQRSVFHPLHVGFLAIRILCCCRCPKRRGYV